MKQDETLCHAFKFYRGGHECFLRACVAFNLTPGDVWSICGSIRF